MDDITSNAQIPQHPVGLTDLLALSPGDEAAFDRLARRVFEYQIKNSPTYRVFAGGADTEAARWDGWMSVPFLPVQAFKWPGIVAFTDQDADAIFLSSATGGQRSRHPVLNTDLYDALATEWFRASVGRGPFCFAAHLPTYEAMGSESSLIHMVRTLISYCGTPHSFFATDPVDLRLRILEQFEGTPHPHSAPLVLFGTAFGLLEMVEDQPFRLPEESLVIETGGMKSRRRDIDRLTLHGQLSRGFGLPRESILSEYGMCEMLSQHYTRGGEAFHSPPWVRTRIVDPEKPEIEVASGETGLLATFDLANCHSVSPLLTEDLARRVDTGFEVLGRLSDAEMRGCNFLFEQER